MRLTLCTDGVFPFAMGGMQRHSRLLAIELARMPDVQLTVIHPHKERVFDPALPIEEINVGPIDPEKLYIRELWRYSGRVYNALQHALPDVIISQGFSVWKHIDRIGHRTIVHPHGLEMFQSLGLKERLVSVPFQIALSGIMRRSAAVVSLGGRLTPIIQRQIKGSGTQVLVIPNATEVPPTITPYSDVDGPLKLLFVGRFAFNKGLDVLLEVAQRLMDAGRADKIRFQLAGDGPLMERIRKQGLPANMELLGRLDDDQLFAHYASCHALVLPTRFEGMPTVVLEAMARCRPIFVSDVGATAELVAEDNGFLLPKGDAAALFNAIKRFVEMDQSDRIGMGLAGYAKAEEKYQWPVVAGSFLKLARTVASTG